jgi:hypothetical protein
MIQGMEHDSVHRKFKVRKNQPVLLEVQIMITLGWVRGTVHGSVYEDGFSDASNVL